MSDRALDTTCQECGGPLPDHLDEERAVRCAVCFDSYLRAIDDEFLQSYAKLGVTSRRTVAETCLRGLVLESPPARKILAMAIIEQFLLASADLIGLVHAVRDRAQRPIVQSFLSFRLDADTSRSFFAELEMSDAELLDAVGLPPPELVSMRYPALPSSEASSLSLALQSLLRDLRTTAQRSSSALLLSELAGRIAGGAALTDRPSWLAEGALRPDQVASLVLDERRRQLVLQAVPVDEHQLGEVVDAIDRMTRAASNLIYAYLTVQDEEERVRALTEGET
jgi:hypothetical protein